MQIATVSSPPFAKPDSTSSQSRLSSLLKFDPSPLQRLSHPAAEAARVEWWVKRDDCYGPGGTDVALQGNKVRKLRGYLEGWRDWSDPRLGILSFGGAYSNHLAALSVAGRRYGFRTIGIVRGESVSNPVLDLCRENGMDLRFVSRSEYRQKKQAEKLFAYRAEFGPVLIIPEGGSGPDSKIGTASIIPEIKTQLGPDHPIHYFQLAAGTGGTAAGVIEAPPGEANPTIEIFPVLKGGWMGEEIEKQLSVESKSHYAWQVIDGHHWGGYAKRPPELLEFCDSFSRNYDIPLESIYTGKLFYAVLQRIETGYYPPGSRLVTYHSGGIY
ncbi:1-aminocyclopropane-1-carboxylate deaminase [Lewinellaceae bacterium SD302]|nr:1-aminocyclopropane-1-carboxylate deaminase [Lewinellaceae bacterium SD302]